MNPIAILIPVLITTAPHQEGGYRKFEGIITKDSPTSASEAIERVHKMFSKGQLAEMRKDPTKILDYGLCSWIEGNWLKNESDNLYVWFNKHGIHTYSSMSLFIVRGFQLKLNNKYFDIQKELKSPGWKLRPPTQPQKLP